MSHAIKRHTRDAWLEDDVTNVPFMVRSYVAHKGFLGSPAKVFGISALARASAVAHARRCVLVFNQWRGVSLDLS